MKENWEYKRLGEVGNVVGGSTPKTSVPEFWGGDNFWVTPAELTGNRYVDSTERLITDDAVVKTNLTLLPVGTVLLTSRAPIGKVCITKVPMFCNQGFKNIICSNQLYNEFLYWWLFGKTDYLNSLGVGATFKEISKRIVEQIIIPVPPLDEQKQIVAELDLLSGVIDKQKAQLKELDNLAQSTFYDMFGDPIENPKGWDNFRLTDVCLKISDGSHNPPKGVDFSDYPMLSSKNILSGSYDYRDPRYLSKEDFDMENTRTNVSDGDVLFTIVGAIGRCCFVKEPFKKFVLQRSVAVLKPNRDMVDSPFLVYSLSCMTSYFERIANGIAQKGVYLKQLAQTQIPIPPLALQQEFADKITSVEKQKAALTQSIAESQKLLDYTMDKYFG